MHYNSIQNQLGNRRHGNSIGIGVSLLVLCVFTSLSEADTIQATNDRIDFFKKTISLPPDVAEFIVSQRSPINLNQLPSGMSDSQKKSIQASSLQWRYYQGARAGSNYYLRQIESYRDTNLLGKSGFIAGNAGSSAYSFSVNSVSYAIGTNATIAGIKSLSGLIRQFLNMGLSDIDPSSVVWNGNQFSALNFSGISRYGILEISNNLPFRVIISMKTNSSPLNIVEYAYPDQPASLVGLYPSKIELISPHEEDPKIEIHLQSVQIATQQLSEAFFSEAKFKGTNITHTSIFSNESTFISDSNGKLIKLPESLTVGVSHPPVGSASNKRWVIFVFFGITTVIPLIIFGWFRKNKNNKK